MAKLLILLQVPLVRPFRDPLLQGLEHMAVVICSPDDGILPLDPLFHHWLIPRPPPPRILVFGILRPLRGRQKSIFCVDVGSVVLELVLLELDV